MRVVGRIVKWLAALLAVAVVGLAGWLYLAPPDLIRVGAGYAAKIVCSNVFLAGRDAQEVLEIDVQAPGHPLLRLMAVDVDTEEGVVTAGLLGLFGQMRAAHRPGFGCTSLPGGDLAEVTPIAADAAEAPTGIWPAGETVEPSTDPAIAEILDDPAMSGPGMRAVVVVQDGRIVGERYGDGFDAQTPLLGWSMTKTVTAAILGTLDDRLGQDAQNLLPNWSDERAQISLANLMAMSSGLAFNEDYGDVTDVTRMLYLEADMAAFAAGKPLVAAPGTAFSYSSGTTVILSRIWQNLFADPAEALAWPRAALFDPIGMASAVLETDAAGTFVGSSYLYATARDWARFGLFLMQEGTWNGDRILPESYVDWMREPAPAADGDYGRGQLWLAGPRRGVEAAIPDDTFWLRGHDGQVVAIIPSRQLVVVRLGLTPSKLDYSASPLVAALAGAAE